MDVINIGIFTKDTPYGIALAEKLTGFQSEYLFYIRSIEDLQDTNNTEILDLILIDGPVENAPAKSIELVDTRSCAYENEETMQFKLFKYGNIKELSLKLLYIYGLSSGRKQISIENRSSRIIFFCSPYGGAGVSAITKSVAEEFSRYMDRKVLYLTFEEIQEAEECAGVRCLGEYLYHIAKEDVMSSFIEPFLIQDRYGYERFKKAGGRNPLRELDSNELHIFMNSIIRTGRFDYILLDSGNHFSDLLLLLMKKSHKICIVLSSCRSAARDRILESFLKQRVGDGFSAKCVKTMNHYCYGEEHLSDPTYDPDSSSKIVAIDHDPQSFKRNGTLEQPSIDLDFGKGIKQLAKLLV